MNERLGDAVRRYVSSVESDAELLPFDVAGTEAHVMMLYQAGIIPEGDATKILAALARLDAGEATLGEAGDAEDGHELLEAYIAGEAGRDAGGKTQTGRSRNDQVAVATRMKLRRDANIVRDGILRLVSVLLDLADVHAGTMVPLYTHLQHAQAGTLSHYFIAQADALLRDYGRFSDMYGRLNASPLGAGPVGGSSLPIDRDATAKMLAFPGLVENALDATSSRDHISEFVSCCAIMMVSLSRMAEDLVLWSSDEFSFVELGDGVSSPSSAMPQKKNPDVLELTRGKTARVIGDLVSVLAIQKGLATGYGRDLQEAKEPAWSSAGTAAGALQVMRDVIAEMTINEKRMAESAESGYLVALDVAERLVAQNVPFRQAHLEVGSLVAAAHAAGKSLDDLDVNEIRQACTLDPEKVAGALSGCTIEKSVQGRASRGATAISEQRRMISDRKKNLDRLLGELELQRDAASAETNIMRDNIKGLLDRKGSS